METINNWTTENELYCQKLGEQSSVYHWMHIKAEQLYRERAYYISLAVNDCSLYICHECFLHSLLLC